MSLDTIKTINMEDNNNKSGSDAMVQQKLVALLFVRDDGMSKKEITKALQIEENDLSDLLLSIEHNLSQIGLVIVDNGESLMLATTSNLAPFVAEYIKSEDERELSKATLETLAIIAYRGPVSRQELEHIRGVNCRFIIRNLRSRGLVVAHKEHDGLYELSLDALRHLGVTSKTSLPEYEKIVSDIKTFEDKNREVKDEIGHE